MSWVVVLLGILLLLYGVWVLSALFYAMGAWCGDRLAEWLERRAK